MKNKFFRDNHAERIKALEHLCTKNASSFEIIKKSRKQGIPGLKWYILLISILLNIYLLIRI